MLLSINQGLLALRQELILLLQRIYRNNSKGKLQEWPPTIYTAKWLFTGSRVSSNRQNTKQQAYHKRKAKCSASPAYFFYHLSTGVHQIAGVQPLVLGEDGLRVPIEGLLAYKLAHPGAIMNYLLNSTTNGLNSHDKLYSTINLVCKLQYHLPL